MSSDSMLTIAVLGALVVGLVAWYNVVRLGRARRALSTCLEKSDLSLVSAHLCWWPRGPFSTAIATHQPVYRVVARDRAGRERTGWVRCAPFSGDAATAWDTRGEPAITRQVPPR
ncbi:MAG: hypothetical protein ACM3O7_02720 [Acidobacteriota bacterium]